MSDVMTADVADTAAVAKRKDAKTTVDAELVGQLVDQARASGLQLTGEGGLLQQLTKLVVESALDGEITDHLGYDHSDRQGRGTGNSRNGTRSKTVVTDVGPVEIDVPRDRDSSFEPQIVRKRQRRLNGVENMVLSLSAKGLTHGEISAHLREVYGAEVSKQTISTITDKVLDGMAEWQNRPLDAVYPVIFLDAIHVKIRDGKVANRPIYVALAVTVDGTRDILGLWAGDGGEGAKFWFQILTELRNRGVADVCMLVCDGLKGLPEAIGEVWPQAVVQHAWCICCGPRSGTRPASTGTRSPKHSSRSTPHRRNQLRWSGSTNSPRNGAENIRPSSNSGRTPGRSSCRSWPSTPRSAGSCARPMRSSRSTPAFAARYAPAGTSRTTKRP
ncbi:Transposase, Mutator family [Nocardia amikacinitolerans]|nr:Transposase, Mutator family [Nocardia amikacinitolerans]